MKKMESDFTVYGDELKPITEQECLVLLHGVLFPDTTRDLGNGVYEHKIGIKSAQAQNPFEPSVEVNEFSQGATHEGNSD
jgi:hypothetical protein